MSAGRVGLDRDREIALAVVICLVAQCTFSADGEERDVWRGIIRAYCGGTSRLPRSATTCIEHIEKPSRIGRQRFNGIGAAGGKGRVLRGGQIAKVVINPVAGDLIVLL